MDKKLICHEIAIVSAKAYCDSNLPEYINTSGIKGYASDMFDKYLEAYDAVKDKLVSLPKSNSIEF